MPANVISSKVSGPITLKVNLPAGSLHVTASPKVTRAEVIVQTTDTTGPSAHAVDDTRTSQTGDLLTVTVPQPPAGSVTHTAYGNTLIQNVGTVTGIQAAVVINGNQVITGASAAPANSPIIIRAVVPAGSSLEVSTTSADVTTDGALQDVTVRSVSGSLVADTVAGLSVKTTSGGITAGQVTGTATVRSVSGTIRLRRYAGPSARLRSTSGDIGVFDASEASGTVAASTVSGDIEMRRADGVHVAPRAVSGYVDIR